MSSAIMKLVCLNRDQLTRFLYLGPVEPMPENDTDEDTLALESIYNSYYRLSNMINNLWISSKIFFETRKNDFWCYYSRSIVMLYIGSRLFFLLYRLLFSSLIYE